MRIIVLSFAFSLLLLSCNNEGKHNLENLEKIKIGMTPEEVEKIMGHPRDTFSVNHYHLIYKYEPPFGYSDDIQVYFDSVYTVIMVHPDSLYRVFNKAN
jgi:outer membrane protein assembly factor BamE (lipoprotein component of BamABCDE complex)